MDAGFLVILHPKLTRNMEEMTVINIVIVTVLVTAVAVYLSMRRQKDAVQDEMNRLTLRLTSWTKRYALSAIGEQLPD